MIHGTLDQGNRSGESYQFMALLSIADESRLSTTTRNIDTFPRDTIRRQLLEISTCFPSIPSWNTITQATVRQLVHALTSTFLFSRYAGRTKAH